MESKNEAFRFGSKAAGVVRENVNPTDKHLSLDLTNPIDREVREG